MTQQKESKLLTEWLKDFHRTDPQWKRVRLGIVADHEDSKEYQVILRWADCVFLKDGRVHIVEAKLRPNASAIGQLEHYAKLFKRTPEFSKYWDWDIKLILLTPVLDLEIVELCSEKDISYENYVPASWSV